MIIQGIANICSAWFLDMIINLFHHTLVECRRFHTAIIVHKILQLSPAYLRETFSYTTTVTSHVGRNSHCLFCAMSRDYIWQE